MRFSLISLRAFKLPLRKFEVGVPTSVVDVSRTSVSSTRIFTALQFQRRMHESSIAATARVLARNVIVKGVLEGPSTATGSRRALCGTAGVAGSGNLCGEPRSSSSQHLSSINYGFLGSTTYSSLESTCARCFSTNTHWKLVVFPGFLRSAHNTDNSVPRGTHSGFGR